MGFNVYLSDGDIKSPGLWVPFYLVGVEYLCRSILRGASYERGNWLVNGLFGGVTRLDPRRLELCHVEVLSGENQALLNFSLSVRDAEGLVRYEISAKGIWGAMARTVQGVIVSATPFYALYVTTQEGGLLDPFSGQRCLDPLLLGAIPRCQWD